MDSPIQLLDPTNSLLLELDVEGGPEKERLASFFVNLISWYHDEHAHKSSTLLPLPPHVAPTTTMIRSTNHIRLSCEHYFQQHPIYALKTLQSSSTSLPQPSSFSPYGSLRSASGLGHSPVNSLNMRSLPIHSPSGSLGGQSVKHELVVPGSNGSIGRSATGSAANSNSSLRGIGVAGNKFSSLGSGSSKRGLDFSTISPSAIESLRRRELQPSTSGSRLTEHGVHHTASTPSSSSPYSSLSSNATSGMGLGGPTTIASSSSSSSQVRIQ